MAKIVKKSPAPLYLAAAVWAAWAVLAPLYAWWHFALAAAVSAVAWLGGRKLFPDKVLILPDPEPAPEPEPEPEHAAPEDPLAVERARALAELRRLDENIEDAKLSAQIVHMEEVTGKIFDIVAGQPAKLPQLRRFLNYYLPTTLKLLNAYDRMGAAGVEGANIDGTMGRIDAMMDKVVEAFDKQLDALFADEALDISTDITVLEQMLAQEGLSMGQTSSPYHTIFPSIIMTFPPKVNVLLTPGAGKGTMKLTSFLEEMSMAKIVKKSPAPLYLAAAVWAAWAVLAPLYAWWHFALAAAVSAVAWLGGRKLFPDKVLILPDPEPAPEPEPEPEHAAPEDPLAVERARALAELRRLDENIEDAKLSAQIVHMEEVTGKIFDIVAGQPAKLPQLRRFLNYYLPTTLKLLNAYDRMGAAGVEGANIDGTMGRIDAMMDKVVEAFDKQLDALFADEALDISTDITVLEQMLAQEGLGGMQMGQS